MAAQECPPTKQITNSVITSNYNSAFIVSLKQQNNEGENLSQATK